MYIHVHIYFSIILFSPQTYSIEFDRDFDYFAIAGVTKKIKVLLSHFILFLAYFITFRILKIVIVAKNPPYCCLWSFDGYLLQSAIQGIFVSKPHNPHRAQCESESLASQKSLSKHFFPETEKLYQ